MVRPAGTGRPQIFDIEDRNQERRTRTKGDGRDSAPGFAASTEAAPSMPGAITRAIVVCDVKLTRAFFGKGCERD